MDVIDEAYRSDKAAKVIPLCVSLIYKHREVEATLWEMIASLATKLRPPSTQAITRVGDAFGRFYVVKHGDMLRTVHPSSDEERALLYLSIEDKTVVVPRVQAVLVGDPGMNGKGLVHVIVGREPVMRTEMRFVWRRLRSIGVC